MTSPVFPPSEVDEAEVVVEYPRGYAFDFAAGEFVMGAGGPKLLEDGHQAWVAWCEKALHIARGAFLIYSDRYGMSFDEVRGTRAEMELMIETAVREALTFDPRTAAVEEFAFTWLGGDAVAVSCVATPTVGGPATLEVTVAA